MSAGIAYTDTSLHFPKVLFTTAALRHSQGVTLQYVALTIADRAAITTRLAVDAYKEELKRTDEKNYCN